MRVLIVRHGIAWDKEKFRAQNLPDSERPLTKEGVRKMKEVARGLAEVAPKLGAIASSPWTRARQTAEIIRRRIDAKFVCLLELSGDADPEAILPWLQKRPAGAAVMLVGHEPYLSELVGLFLIGSPNPFVKLRKGGACLIDFDGKAEPGRGTMAWLMKPSQLRKLG